MNIDDASNLLSLISDKNRLAVIVYLRNKLHANGMDLLRIVDCKQATLSHHLNELVDAGLLNNKKKGNQVIYSLNARKFQQLVSFLGSVDRITKTTPIEEEKEVIRVSESKIIKEKEERKKNELPDFLL